MSDDTEVTIEYVRAAVGHPDVGSVVTVERTRTVGALLAQGIAVEVDEQSAGTAVLTGSGLRDGEQTAPDGSTVLPAEKKPRARRKADADE